VAKETRTQRRARREARETSVSPSGAGALAPAAGGPPSRPPSTPPVASAADDHHRGGPRIFRFIRESSAELKKVEWPTQAQVVTGTTVVLIACIIVGVFLYINDEVWKRVVEHIVLR
jgi:preprotein translocase SecE subunit